MLADHFFTLLRDGSNMKKNLLIFDPEPGGHRVDYFSIIHRTAYHQGCDRGLVYAINCNNSQRFIERVRNWGTCVDESQIAARNGEWLSKKDGVLKSISLFKLALSIAKDKGCTDIMFMRIDAVQVPFIIRMTVPWQMRMHGVLFSPTVHYRSMFGDTMSSVELFKTIRKNYVYKCLVNNGSVGSIFSLDPYFVKFWRSRNSGVSKIKYLSDPVVGSGAKEIVGDDLRDKSTVFKGNDTLKLFMFGSLQRRKGIIQLLKCLSILEESKAKIKLVIAGIVQKSILLEVNRLLEQHQNQSRGSVKVQLENKYLDEKELSEYIGRCDIVLMPYIRFAGSSGVYLRAVDAGKPVITQNYGLLGAYVRLFGNGVVCDTRKPAAIAKAITSCIQNYDSISEKSRTMRAGVIRRNSADKFANGILSILKSCA